LKKSQGGDLSNVSATVKQRSVDGRHNITVVAMFLNGGLVALENC